MNNQRIFMTDNIVLNFDIQPIFISSIEVRTTDDI